MIDPDRWVLLEPAGLEEAIAFIDQSKYKQAEEIYKNVLFIDSTNSVAKKMLRHVNYSSANPGKKDFFKRYLGTYKVNENRIYNVIDENGDFYLTSRRIKYRMYPVSEHEFVVTEFNADYYFEFDENKNVAALVLENRQFRMQANKIE